MVGKKATIYLFSTEAIESNAQIQVEAKNIFILSRRGKAMRLFEHNSPGDHLKWPAVGVHDRLIGLG